jgi:hypothetical protein
MIPTPDRLFIQFENGEIGREELHALMAVHARECLADIERDHQDPVAGMLETLSARRAMRKLVRQHGARLLRESLIAMAALPDFPPAKYLWNASHPDVPLYCFLRMRREPVFRIRAIRASGKACELMIEHGSSIKTLTERCHVLLERDERWILRARLSG